MGVRKRTWTSAGGEAKTAWVADYSDASGRHIKTFERKRDAEDFAASTKIDIRDGLHQPESKSLTVAKAADKWLEACEANALERSTLAQYRQHVALHIKPFIGALKLTELTAPGVDAFAKTLRRGDPAPGEAIGRKRSAIMVRKILTSLSQLIGEAQATGAIRRNVVRDLNANRKRGAKTAERRQRGHLKVGADIPTVAEVKAILAAAEGRWKPLLMVAIFAGLRASELRGLRWRDVDFKKAEVRVEQRADRYNAIGKPKSASSERTIPLPANVVQALRKWKLACPKGELDLVFPTRAGGLEHHKNIVRFGLDPTLIAAKVVTMDAEGEPQAKYGLHALRHFFASWCLNRRVDGGLELPLKVVQSRLGHSSITMTADVYGHLFQTGDDGGELTRAAAAFFA